MSSAFTPIRPTAPIRPNLMAIQQQLLENLLDKEPQSLQDADQHVCDFLAGRSQDLVIQDIMMVWNAVREEVVSIQQLKEEALKMEELPCFKFRTPEFLRLMTEATMIQECVKKSLKIQKISEFDLETYNCLKAKGNCLKAKGASAEELKVYEEELKAYAEELKAYQNYHDHTCANKIIEIEVEDTWGARLNCVRGYIANAQEKYQIVAEIADKIFCDEIEALVLALNNLHNEPENTAN